MKRLLFILLCLSLVLPLSADLKITPVPENFSFAPCAQMLEKAQTMARAGYSKEKITRYFQHEISQQSCESTYEGVNSQAEKERKQLYKKVLAGAAVAGLLVAGGAAAYIIYKKSTKKEPFDGNRNMVWKSNWCWMTSTLQVLARVDSFVEYLKDRASAVSKDSLEYKLYDVLTALQDQSKNTEPLDPQSLYDSIIKELNFTRNDSGNVMTFVQALGEYLEKKDPAFAQGFRLDQTVKVSEFQFMRNSYTEEGWTSEQCDNFAQTLTKLFTQDNGNSSNLKNLPKAFCIENYAADHKKRFVPERFISPKITGVEQKEYELVGMMIFDNIRYAKCPHYMALSKDPKHGWGFYNDLTDERTLVNLKADEKGNISNHYKTAYAQAYYYKEVKKQKSKPGEHSEV